MARPVRFSPEAEAKVVELYRYIVRESGPRLAAAFTNAIVDHCESLDLFPTRGAPRDDLRPGLRVLTFRRRVTIAYAIKPDAVKILGVFYGGQDLAGALKDD